MLFRFRLPNAVSAAFFPLVRMQLTSNETMDDEEIESKFVKRLKGFGKMSTLDETI